MKAAIEKFWKSFLQNKSELEMLQSAEDPVYDRVLESLQRVDPGLYFELCTVPGDNEFIVTAEGERRLFPLVEAVVQGAPVISGWEFFALKPKRSFPVKASWEKTVVSIGDVLVLPVFRDTGEMGIRLFVDGLNESNEEDIHNALLRALDVGLGERRFAESVQATWVYPAGESPEDAFPLVELDEFLDRESKEGK